MLIDKARANANIDIIAMGEGAKASLGAFDYLIGNPVPEAQTAIA
ncbi:hypothetical protein [uncultured Ferrimonas sp.]|nr:hypothetical protein [uncultured Ferrimonas sp.]